MSNKEQTTAQQKTDKKKKKVYHNDPLGQINFEQIISKLSLIERAQLKMALMPETDKPGQVHFKRVQVFCRKLEDMTIQSKVTSMGPVETKETTVKEVKKNHQNGQQPKGKTTTLGDVANLGKQKVTEVKAYEVDHNYVEKDLDEKEYRALINVLKNNLVCESELAYVGGSYKYRGTFRGGDQPLKLFERIGDVVEMAEAVS